MSAAKLSLDDALQMLAECFAEAAADLGPERVREDIAGWDSMGALMLMAELDERCHLQLSAEQSRSLRSVGDVLAFLRAHRRLAE
jgi:acyl carrier protein